MNLTEINGAVLKQMVVTAAAVLEANKQTLNDLNVFPVPDGDTGTNMSLTMLSVLKEVSTCSQDDLASVARAMSRGALKAPAATAALFFRRFSAAFQNSLKPLKRQKQRI